MLKSFYYKNQISSSENHFSGYRISMRHYHY